MKILVRVLMYGLALAGPALFADEISSEARRALDFQEAARLWMLKTNPDLRYQGSAVTSACGNGDFETDIESSAEWEGASGTVDSSGDLNLPFTTGIAGGPINSSSSHQTWVVAGMDPIVPISTVAPPASSMPPSAHAVRIGNAVNGYGAELLSKTFTVTSANSLIKFWYAVVFEDPEHPPHQQPSFWVRVLDAGGAEIPGVVNLGPNVTPDKLVSDSANPFFKTLPGSIVYRDWSCAQIDLAGQIGRTVTVQFITEDCAQGGHYGYAYVDNFCGACIGDTSGNVELDAGGSNSCGAGKLCFDYALPVSGGTTGTVQLRLDVFQGGVTIASFNSPVLSSGTKYCFNIDPSTIAGLNPGTFDFSATGSFAIGTTTLAPKSTTRRPYQTQCDTPGGCCPGPNLVSGGDFESGTAGFTSDYTNVPAPSGPGAVLPGQYAVLTSAQASANSSTWQVQNHSPCNTTGKFLAVNGATGQAGKKKVWAQAVPVTAGAEYRFCANFRNLAQCDLDVKPRIEIRFSAPSSVVPSTISANASNSCAWIQETRSVVVPAGVTSLTAEIWLDESGAGDGNDLAVDDISLHEMQKASPSHVLVNIASSNLTATSYNITATPAPQTLSHYWEVCEADSAGNCLPATQAVNPSAWFAPGANDFRGYVGSSTLGTLTSPGIFQVGKKYKIVYGVFDTCTSFTSSTWYFSFNLNSGRIEVERAMR